MPDRWAGYPCVLRPSRLQEKQVILQALLMYSGCAYLPMRQSGSHNAHAPSSPASSRHRETATVFKIRRISKSKHRQIKLTASLGSMTAHMTRAVSVKTRDLKYIVISYKVAQWVTPTEQSSYEIETNASPERNQLLQLICEALLISIIWFSHFFPDNFCPLYAKCLTGTIIIAYSRWAVRHSYASTQLPFQSPWWPAERAEYATWSHRNCCWSRCITVAATGCTRQLEEEMARSRM